MAKRTARHRLTVTAFVAVLGLVVTLAVAEARDGSAASGSAAAAVQTRPNIVVIESDDQTAESMRVMKSVNSMIGAQGATFKNSTVNFSLCCPSRATFLTGQYAHNHHVLSNNAPTGGFPRFQSLHARNNLAVWLKQAGYHTALIGKYLNEYRNQPSVPPGWSEWHAVAPNWTKAYDYSINDNGTLDQFGQSPADYEQDVLTSKAVYLINHRSPGTEPFFLWLTYMAPHTAGPDPNPRPPHNCAGAAKAAPRDAHAFDDALLPMPPNFNEADVSDKPQAVQKLPLMSPSRIEDIQRKYRCELESLLSIDLGVKKVVSALQAARELDNTLMIYTSDNGYFHGEHRIPEEKRRTYEESIRVPLEMRGPGIPKGVKPGGLVTNADLAPTIVDAANAKAGLAMDGRSLLPVAQKPSIDRNRELLVEEPGLSAIRTERYLYAEYETGEKELYDLRNDPYELDSLHADPTWAAVQSLLANRLHHLESCAGASCRVFQPDPPAP